MKRHSLSMLSRSGLVAASLLMLGPPIAAQTRGGPIWSSYLGGAAGDDWVRDVYVAPNGETVVCGNTTSSRFPVTAGAFDRTYAGHRGGRGTGDGFVAKISADGTKLIFATYLGGNEGDEVTAVHVDANGIVTVAGHTHSTDFPTTADAYRPKHGLAGAATDAFVCRLSADGAKLLYSTYFGGLGSNGSDRAGGVHVDSAKGWIYLVGSTGANGFPTTADAYQRQTIGSIPAYLAILDLKSKPNATVLRYSTLLGAKVSGIGRLTVGAGGVVTISGITHATNFPTTAGAFQSSKPGFLAGFVSRLDPSRARTRGLLYSTYFGSSGVEDDFLAGSDAAGRVCIVGSTRSSKLPTTTGSFQQKYTGGTRDLFVARLDPAKQGKAQLLYGSFLGGGHDDRVTSMHLAPDGVMTFVGRTDGRAVRYPTTTGAFQSSARRGGFVTRFDASKPGKGALLYSSNLSLCGSAFYEAVHYDARSGTAAIAGHGSSKVMARRGAFQPQPSDDGTDGFAMRFGFAALPPATRAFGASCKGTVGTPSLRPSQHAELCQSYRIVLQGARPRQPALMYLGFSKTAWGPIKLPLKLDAFGMSGCTLYTGGEVIDVLSTGSTGTTGFSFVIPRLPQLIGGTFYQQCLFLDRGANRLGLVTTNGIEADIRL